ncbi:hypothetical protein [Ureaplasma ceti]|uniref:Uncharacterized protein n=1 Tax=Ureaplasma ceti TaxID=3119530 RepID=A0ABP9U8U5_9BACT
MSIAMSIFSLLGTFIIGFSMLPQTIMTMRLKDTAKLSLPLYFVMGVATFLIFIYGIGLCVVPNPQWNTEAVGTTGKSFADMIGPGSFHWDHAKGANANNSSWVFACYQNWVSGFVVPGAAVIFGELLCAITSFMIAAVKIQNMISAKKAGVSEAEYVEQHFGEMIKAHAEKMNHKTSLKEKLHHEARGA